MMSRFIRALAACVLLACAPVLSAELDPHATDYAFAAFGDTPYSTDEEQQFVAMIAEMNHSALAFVVHVGDFKSATTVCSDALYLQRRDWFRLSHHPFVYVPGDNEWSDCWRPFASGRDPLERLAKLRDIFFDSDQALGQSPLTLERQMHVAREPGMRYPEHSRWMYGRVVYATLNLPGPDNNRTRMPEEAALRMMAAREWMKSTFALARELQLPAVVLFMQADLWRPNGQPRPAFAELLQDVASEASRYRGKVLLVHGDTHQFRVDHPLFDPGTRRAVKNVTRLEVYGSPIVNWVHVKVQVRGDSARFEITPGSSFGNP